MAGRVSAAAHIRRQCADELLIARTQAPCCVEIADNRVWLAPHGTEFFCGDLSEAEQTLVWATHIAPDAGLLHLQKLTADRVAWRTKPSWYVLAPKDHTAPAVSPGHGKAERTLRRALVS